MPDSAGAFVQPALPGYSPWPTARQDSPFLQTPGVQGLQEGVSQGQGLAFSPTQEFFAGGTEGTAPPSSISPGSNMWGRFGGSGGAMSSTAQPAGMMAPPPGAPAGQTGPLGPQNVQPLMTALRGGQPNAGA